tara:strand:+ start:3642 stop:4313 length:672 start_codon:yes stop_codon:yes gene_type:complete
MMIIVIACSKSWFAISDYLKNNHQIIIIKEKHELTLENIKKINPNLIFFPHWSWKVPNEIHKKYKCILFHTAPLPFGRGGSPIQNLILLGYKKSPVCALRMVEELDAGPIYSKSELSLEGPLSTIFKRLNIIVNDLIKELIEFMPEPTMQKGNHFHFRRLNKEDNKIPNKGSLENFYDRVRMLDDSTYPNPFIVYGDYIIEFNEAKFSNGEITCTAQIKFNNN